MTANWQICPRCGNNNTKWRHGVHFDHDRICYHCWHIWEPEEPKQTMTPDQARTTLLEDALRQAQHLVEFLHGCLAEPERFHYAHPGQTMKHLRDWNELVPLTLACYHSKFDSDCSSCQLRKERMQLLTEARKVLGVQVQ